MRVIGKVLIAAAALLLSSWTLQAQKILELSGVILDVEGSPMGGVVVSVRDRGIWTVSDNEGGYVVAGLNVRDVVTFELMGYQTQEFEYNGNVTHNVVMRIADEVLDDVVVVGYGTQKKISVTGALSGVDPHALESKPTTTLSNVLAGSMPGIISRQSTGEPGNDYANIYIRGIGTWGDKTPLVMVDGVERDINLINTQEIESFTILKDASATAVYGVRGANGVILINTKKGSMGKPKVVLRTEHAVLQGLRFPDYISGYESASLMNEAVNHGTAGTGTAPWSEEALQKFKDGSDSYLYPDVNWIDEVLNKTAYQTINNLNVTGGNEIIRYFLNVGYTSQGGLYKSDPQYKYDTNARSDRYNFRSTIDVNIARNLLFSMSLGCIFQDKTYPGTSSASIFASMRQVSPIEMPVRNPDGTPGCGASAVVLNPWALSTQSGYAKQFISTIQSTANMKWDLSEQITEGLSLSGKFAFDLFYANYVNRNIAYEMKRLVGFDEETGDPVYNQIREQGTMGYSIGNSANRSYYWDLSLNYDRAFGNNNLSGMLLFNRRDYKELTAGSSIYNLPYRRQGLAGRFTYDYSHRYMAELNFGYNGSENFAKGRRYGLFPSLSLGWVLSNEKFIPAAIRENVYFKIRGSYGVVGNDQIGGDRFLYVSTVNYGNGAMFGTTQQSLAGIYEGKIGADVTWEKAYKTDIGFDLRLLDDALSIQADYFNEDRRDILLTRGVIPFVTGITAATYANLGEVNNKGFDAMVEWKHQTPGGFYYSFYGNATYAHNVIIENDTPTPKYLYQDSRGTSIGQTFGYVALGLFQSQEEIDNSPRQTFMTTVRPGDIKYKDMNNDGIIDAYNRTYIGRSRVPELMYGFGFSLSYRGVDFSMGFTGAALTDFFLTGEDMWPYSLEYPRYNIAQEYYNHRWIEGADNSRAKYPAVINGNNTNNYQVSTQYMVDGSYLKCKNAEIGYRLPEKCVRKVGVEGVRFFLNGLNLFCLDKVRIVDPESDGGTGEYPKQRSLNLGVQVNF